MASILLNKPISLQTILPGNIYAIKEIRPRYAYNNGVRTDTLEGFTYVVVNMTSLDQISILVKQTSPVITPEDLAARQSKNEKVLVEFTNGIIRQYLRRSEGGGSPEDSISADGIRILPNK